MTRVGNKTLGELISHIQVNAKLYTERDIPPSLIKNWLNQTQEEIHAIFGSDDHLDYKDRATLPITNKSYRQSCSDRGAILHTGTSWTNNTKTLVVVPAPDSRFWTSDADGFDSEWLNATVHFRNVNGGWHTGLVDTVVNAYTVTLKQIAYPEETGGDSPLNNITNNYLEVEAIPSAMQSDIIDISGFTYWRNIDRITSIEDSINGKAVEFTEFEFQNLSLDGPSYLYNNKVCFMRENDKIYMRRGANIVAYGIRTMHYLRTPIAMSADDHYVDIKAKHNTLLTDVVLFRVLKMTSPETQAPELQFSYNAFLNAKESTMKEIQETKAGKS